MVKKTSDSKEGLKETKTPQEKGLLLILGISGTAICICETRVTLYSHWGQRLQLGFLMDRQLVSVSKLNTLNGWVGMYFTELQNENSRDREKETLMFFEVMTYWLQLHLHNSWATHSHIQEQSCRRWQIKKVPECSIFSVAVHVLV